MTQLLMSQENPTGHKLEELLNVVVGDLEHKNEALKTFIANSDNPEMSEKILKNNLEIIKKLKDCIDIQNATMTGLDSLGEDKGPTHNRLTDK